MELTYKHIGDYYIPDLGVGEDEHQYIGRWGMMHANYLKGHRPGVYTRLILSGKYTQYLGLVLIRIKNLISRRTSVHFEADKENEV